MEQVGPAGREHLRLTNAVERADRVAHREADPGARHQHFDVAAGPAGQLVRQRRGFGRPAQREERADLAQGGIGIVGRARSGLAVALQRLAVEPPLGEDVAQQHRRRRARRAARGGARDLGQREIEQTLGDVVAGQVERIARAAAGAALDRRGQLLEQPVEHRGVELELSGQLLAARFGTELRARWRWWDPRTGGRW